MLRALLFAAAGALGVSAEAPAHEFIQVQGKCESPVTSGMLMETGNSIYYVAHGGAPSGSFMGLAGNETDASVDVEIPEEEAVDDAIAAEEESDVTDGEVDAVLSESESAIEESDNEEQDMSEQEVQTAADEPEGDDDEKDEDEEEDGSDSPDPETEDNASAQVLSENDAAEADVDVAEAAADAEVAADGDGDCDCAGGDGDCECDAAKDASAGDGDCDCAGGDGDCDCDGQSVNPNAPKSTVLAKAFSNGAADLEAQGIKKVYGNWVKGDDHVSRAWCPENTAVVSCKPSRKGRQTDGTYVHGADARLCEMRGSWDGRHKRARAVAKCSTTYLKKNKLQTKGAYVRTKRRDNHNGWTGWAHCNGADELITCTCHSWWMNCNGIQMDKSEGKCRAKMDWMGNGQHGKVYAVCGRVKKEQKVRKLRGGKLKIIGWPVKGDDSTSKATCPSGTVVESCRPSNGVNTDMNDGSYVEGNGRTCVAKGSWKGRSKRVRAIARCSKKGKYVKGYPVESGKKHGTGWTNVAKCVGRDERLGCACHSWWFKCGQLQKVGKKGCKARVRHNDHKNHYAKAYAICGAPPPPPPTTTTTTTTTTVDVAALRAAEEAKIQARLAKERAELKRKAKIAEEKRRRLEAQQKALEAKRRAAEARAKLQAEKKRQLLEKARKEKEERLRKEAEEKRKEKARRVAEKKAMEAEAARKRAEEARKKAEALAKKKAEAAAKAKAEAERKAAEAKKKAEAVAAAKKAKKEADIKKALAAKKAAEEAARKAAEEAKRLAEVQRLKEEAARKAAEEAEKKRALEKKREAAAKAAREAALKAEKERQEQEAKEKALKKKAAEAEEERKRLADKAKRKQELAERLAQEARVRKAKELAAEAAARAAKIAASKLKNAVRKQDAETHFHKLGCYKLDADHEPSSRTVSNTMSLFKCHALCFKNGGNNFRFFAVEKGSECKCYDFIDKQEQDPSMRMCDVSCAGKTSEKCGGKSYASVYVNFACYDKKKKSATKAVAKK